MKIAEVLNQVKKLYPNTFTDEELLNWCYSVTCTIRERYKDIYERATFKGGGDIALSPLVLFEDIVKVYINGVEIEKSDETAFLYSLEELTDKDTVEIVHRVRAEPYGETELEGYTIKNSALVFEEEAPIYVYPSDKLRFIYTDGTEAFFYVLDITGNVITLNDSPGNNVSKISTVMEDETEVPPPFDDMYIQFVLAKIGFYQNDVDMYNKHISIYNSLMNDYGAWYKRSAPIKSTQFKNMW